MSWHAVFINRIKGPVYTVLNHFCYKGLTIREELKHLLELFYSLALSVKQATAFFLVIKWMTISHVIQATKYVWSSNYASNTISYFRWPHTQRQETIKHPYTISFWCFSISDVSVFHLWFDDIYTASLPVANWRKYIKGLLPPFFFLNIKKLIIKKTQPSLLTHLRENALDGNFLPI